MENLCVVFDLDDTLYKEIDFLKSAYRVISSRLENTHIAQVALYDHMIVLFEQNHDVLGDIQNQYGVSKSTLLDWYRTHTPKIELSPSARVLMEQLREKGVKMGLITDGRGVTQRAKIEALGLYGYIDKDDIIVSEEFGTQKPAKENYEYFILKYPNHKYVYIGDNVSKDFIAPNSLRWQTIGLKDNGYNIHQNKPISPTYNPSIWVDDLVDILPILFKGT